MQCSKCNNQLTADEVFCDRCGTKQANSTAQPAELTMKNKKMVAIEGVVFGVALILESIALFLFLLGKGGALAIALLVISLITILISIWLIPKAYSKKTVNPNVIVRIFFFAMFIFCFTIVPMLMIN
jgi:uncharacterized membrane protein YvbJ